MNTIEFKFGHRVEVRNNDQKKWSKGKFISNLKSFSPYCVLLNGIDEPVTVRQCRLDPDATEFLPGDEVEVRENNTEVWGLGLYVGFVSNSDSPHHIEFGEGDSLGYKQCRYPQTKAAEQPSEQPKPAQIIELNGRKYEIREVQE